VFKVWRDFKAFSMAEKVRTWLNQMFRYAG